jgi:hypothetical protein
VSLPATITLRLSGAHRGLRPLRKARDRGSERAVPDGRSRIISVLSGWPPGRVAASLTAKYAIDRSSGDQDGPT